MGQGESTDAAEGAEATEAADWAEGAEVTLGALGGDAGLYIGAGAGAWRGATGLLALTGDGGETEGLDQIGRAHV